jgi:hypothetical protein
MLQTQAFLQVDRINAQRAAQGLAEVLLRQQ